jgi:hypothetical protein
VAGCQRTPKENDQLNKTVKVQFLFYIFQNLIYNKADTIVKEQTTWNLCFCPKR